MKFFKKLNKRFKDYVGVVKTVVSSICTSCFFTPVYLQQTSASSSGVWSMTLLHAGLPFDSAIFSATNESRSASNFTASFSLSSVVMAAIPTDIWNAISIIITRDVVSVVNHKLLINKTTENYFTVIAKPQSQVSSSSTPNSPFLGERRSFVGCAHASGAG